ncbi:MAG: hypothetical protein OXU20_28820 [Myxococcales bacterium]|nr:hypothetical protein [Myxococcales bacterium]
MQRSNYRKSSPVRHLALAWFAGALLCGGPVGCGGDDDVAEVGDAGTDGAVADACTRTGTQGCPCESGERCGRGPDGAQLMCTGGLCESPACESGERGCVCRRGVECDGDDDRCVGGFCQRAECEPGEAFCSCAGGSCDPGLYCQNGVTCLDATGKEGGPCRDNGRCDRGKRCDVEADLCVHCEFGSAGCACRDGGCNPGLSCQADVCSDPSLQVPENPKCYTPCRGDLTDGDEVHTCDADGLLEDYCPDGQGCVDGSCVEEGESPRSCELDVECPFFQTCLEGGCYSNCEDNGDCPPGKGCHRKVCRATCDGAPGRAACGAGFACDAPDGTNGFCAPIGTGTGTGTGTGSRDSRPRGGFRVNERDIPLSNVLPEVSFPIISEGGFAQDVTVRKLWHTVHYADGGSDHVEAPLDGDACEGDACPLPWLHLESDEATAETSSALTIEVPGNCEALRACPELTVTVAGEVDASRWEGGLEFCSRSGCSDPVTVSYAQRPEGQWAGTLHYFGSFGEEGLGAWRKDRDPGRASEVGNALIRKWAEFRRGTLKGGWDEFLAILTSTREGSWAFKRAQDECGDCYPYANDDPGAGIGFLTYSDNLDDNPIPTGEARFPIALNLAPGSGPTLEGRIASGTALQYAGNPRVSLRLEREPEDPDACHDDVKDVCAVFLESLSADVVLGGRYYADNARCDEGYLLRSTPWLLPGFEQFTAPDDKGGRYRHECRDTGLPYPEGVAGAAGINAALSEANPVPDGRERRRTLRLLDGVLVDQALMFILFEESFESFIPTEEGEERASAYGYMLLRQTATHLGREDFEATEPADVEREPRRTGVSCSQDILDRTSASPAASNLDALAAGELELLTRELMLGPSLSGAGWAKIGPGEMHWYCEETGLIDGGVENDGVDRYADYDLEDDGSPRDGAVPLPRIVHAWACPSWSKVTYFAIPEGVLDQADIAALPCNQLPNASEDLSSQESDSDSCHATVENWRRSGVIDAYSPPHECSNGASFCDPSDGLDYLANKTFYRPTITGPADPLPPLLTSLAQAFRYKLRFKSSSGGPLGFVPQQCIPGSDQIPYCYEPPVIEEIRARLDCLIDIYSHHADGLRAEAQTELNEFLRGSFSTFKRPGTKTPIHEGFEHLYAELLVMLGDEALTAAYASRFDLAGVAGAAFEGSRFEHKGIDLTGVAGFEMTSLYRAVQYYQLALDRLYQMGPNYAVALGKSASTDDTTVLVSPETVTAYIERLVRAATQKARTQGEIAKRYQAFNRADLARAVLERAYTGTYLESVMLSDLMVRIEAKSQDRNIPQIRDVTEDAQLRYRMALLDMRDVYDSVLTDDSITHFGFAPNYIPLPALDSNDFRQSNAYESLSATARQKVAVAREREQIALQSNRSQRVDTAAFQSELVRVRNTYENQLTDLCGTFEGLDGEIYPAIGKYAHLSDTATLYGDPCGRMGNGHLFQAMQQVEDAGLSLRGAILRHDNLYKQIAIEERRVKRQCGISKALLDIAVGEGDKRKSVQRIAGGSAIAMKTLQRGVERFKQFSRLRSCAGPTIVPPTAGTCPQKIAAGVAIQVAGSAADATLSAVESVILDKELALTELENQRVEFELEQECVVAELDSEKRVKTLLTGLLGAELEAQRANYAVQLQLSEVQRLTNQAQRLSSQQAQAEALLLDVQAKRNDPNVRLYRNDDVLNADLAFDDAMRAVYRATRVFEYYTSQSYAKRDQLFLIRMVSAGEYSLENYMVELDNAFFEYEEQFGVPDRRVQILSLRDDIMQVPLFDEAGRPLSRSGRIEIMRERLRDARLLNGRGYLRLPFSTSFDELSPLTRNHKLRAIEVDIVGSDVGDTLGRVYLRATGTGQVASLSGYTDYYLFPDRTAVVDTFFNGNRVFDPAVYRSVRLRDRPLVNTLWELVINQRDEEVNADIDLQSLTDIRLLFHYTDVPAP